MKRATTASCAMAFLALGCSVASGHGRGPSFGEGAQGASTATVPTLGIPTAQGQEGYGRVRPAKIFNGGDPTGLVTHVRWSNWGGRRAIGQGIGDFIWPGQSVGGGSIQAPASIMAYDRGSCRGHVAYRKIEWYFPSYGQSFEPNEFQEICGGHDYPRHVEPPECASTAIDAGEGLATSIRAKGISCVKARELVANSPAMHYFSDGGRFIYSGLYCGTEGYNPELSSPPISYECARGRVSVFFEVSA